MMQNNFLGPTSANTNIAGNTMNTQGGNINFNQSAEDPLDRFLKDLDATDPRVIKSDIELSKDELLEESCSWIFEDPAFCRWQDDPNCRLLWIHGDPGKGKTMMLLALLSRLSARTAHEPSNLTYFFCQSNITGRNTATSILKGLIHLILSEQRGLVYNIRRHSNAPKTLSALFDVLKEISTNDSMPSIYVVIDALDECDEQLPELLKCISKESRSPQTKIKWLVSSRNLITIRESMSSIQSRVNADLELNEPRVSNGVTSFVKYKIQELAQTKGYSDETRDAVASVLVKKAEGTFLWVSLACKELEESFTWDVEDVLAEIPPGLEPLYSRMIDKVDQLSSRRDRGTTTLCKSILSLVSVARRNLRLEELSVLAGLPESKFKSADLIEKLVSCCGSFLVIRDTTVYFVHQSARDFLLGIGKQRVFFLGEKPCTESQMHRDLVSRCISFMSKTLQMDLCRLGDPGATISESGALIQKSLPPPIRYMSRYWIEHL